MKKFGIKARGARNTAVLNPQNSSQWGAVSSWNLRGSATRIPRPQHSPGPGRSTTRRLRPLDPCLPQL